MGRCTGVIAGFTLLLAGGCREGVPPFTLIEREPATGPYALTFGYGQDADPHWSPAGDTVIYHTSLFGELPQARGALAAVPRSGGAAVPILEDVQVPLSKLLATPVFSPDGARIAYMDLMSVDVPGTCQRVERTPDGQELEPRCAAMQPLLDSAVLRVRNVGEPRDEALDPRVTVRFEGTDAGHRFGSDGPWFEHFFPFQVEHRSEYAMLFRPSWAPDGERIAFSDGLSIHVWRIGDAASSVIPGTTDGVSAAWSPDAEWIAYTVLPRADSITYECSCGPRQPPVTAFVTAYTVGERAVVLVRPDGSERIELGAGEDPAWSPDGAFIYARRGDEIVRMPRAGGAATPIPDTSLGRSPAVSPDGAWLAFSRRKPQPTMDYDIWVVSLAQ